MPYSKIQYILACIQNEWLVKVNGFEGKITSLNYKKNIFGETRPYSDIKSEGIDAYIDMTNVEIEVVFK